MKKFWDNISLVGLKHLSREEVIIKYRSTVLINRMGFVIIGLMLLFLPFEIYTNGFRLVPFILFDGFTMGILFFLNYRHKYEAAKYVFLFIGIFLLLPSTMMIPGGAGNELMMIPASTLGILLLRNKNAGLIYAGISLMLFGAVFYVRATISPIINIPETVVKQAYPMFSGMTLIIVACVVYYFKGINEDFHSIIEHQREELEKSNEIILEKNKEITDSINYAKNIQGAFLPSMDTFNKLFPDGFVLFQPKDIVSGDFYWFLKSKLENKTLVAVADCTGHGVPGALMSVICSNALNDVTVTRGISDTGQILDETRTNVIKMLKSSSNTGRKDGMDIVLVSIDHEKQEIQFSGANNPLWIIRKNTLEILEIKGDKQPIGQFDNAHSFASHKIQLEKGDCIYLFSDGFADQFGGPKGKKFKYAQLKQTLKTHVNSSMEEQHKQLITAFNAWKGELEQVDDVCIVGIRL